MSFITGRGKEAKRALTEEKKDYSKALVTLKSGNALKVRIPGDDVYVTYGAHSVFKVFYTTPCVKPAGQPCAYCKASEQLYKEAFASKEAGNEKQYEEKKDQAYQLKAKDRVMFGFFNLEDGEPIVVDFTSKQAKGLITAIEKNAKHLGKFAFELSKHGSSTDTTVSLTVILDEDDLSDTEKKNFEASADKKFDDELFEKVLSLREYTDQVEDLKKFGFYFEDTSQLPSDPSAPPEIPDDSELPF